MNIRTTLLCIFLITFELALGSRADAGFIEYTVHEDWFDAVGGAANVTTIDFDELPVDTTVTDHYQSYGVTFTGLNFVSPSILDPDGATLRIFNGNDIYFSEPITYFGADIGGTVEYEVYSGDTLLFDSQWFGNPPTEDFGGIISDVPFDRVHVSDPGDSLAIFWDMHFGPPIPAPASALPLGVLLLPRRRRR